RIDVAQRLKNCRALTERDTCQNSKKRADQHPKRQAPRHRPATRRRRCRPCGCFHAASHPQCPAFFITRSALGRVCAISDATRPESKAAYPPIWGGLFSRRAAATAQIVPGV